MRIFEIFLFLNEMMRKIFSIPVKFTAFIALYLWWAELPAQQIRMWVPSDTRDYYYQLQESGAQMKAVDLFDAQKPSLNDAVVQFNGGCTAGLISGQGLLLTNHHCGYGAIQSHSTLEHNYVKDGFWAGTLDDELPNPGMYVTFVRAIYDVTDKVLQGVSDDMDEASRQSHIDKNINRLKRTLPKKSWQEITVKPAFYGNKYYAYVTETYKDIRLVGAPPSAIGKFGADTDNWMWPRHSGDFSLFRIYADRNNRPAEYSKDNVPYHPEKYFQVSTEGVSRRDLIIVYGFPGRTREYLPAFRVRQITGRINPVRIGIRERALRVMDGFMHTNDTIKLKYTALYARIANYWKKWKGENLGIRRSDALANKEYWEQLTEKELAKQGKADEYREVKTALENTFRDLEPVEIARNVFIEAGYLNNPWMQRAFAVYEMERGLQKGGADAFEREAAKTARSMEADFQKGDRRVNKALFAAMTDVLKEKMPRGFLPEVWSGTAADDIVKAWDQSFLTDAAKMKKLLSGDFKHFENALKNDSGYKMARALINGFYGKINPEYHKRMEQVQTLMRKYVRLQMQAFPRMHFAPDANGTLRVSFGRVEGYEPRDGVYYEPFSTLDGVIEKYIPGDYEFDLPKALLDIYEHKDYGKWEVNGTVPVNFLGTAHTTGGNSGSPVLNAKGELVGLNFDRVWEGTMSDLYYDPAICRNIMVDVRYILFIMDKLGHATRLLDEINLENHQQ